MAIGMIQRNIYDHISYVKGTSIGLTTPTSGCVINGSGDECALFKIGTLIQLNATLNCSAAIAAFKTIITVPEKYKPNTSQGYGIIISSDGSGVSNTYFIGGTNSKNIANRTTLKAGLNFFTVIYRGYYND